MHHRLAQPLVSLSLLAAVAAPLGGQAAVDPTIAPRAMHLARGGARVEATELLGRYLATAPDDAGAWRALGWFYLLDSREWHQRGHVGDPPGTLYLDFAAAALDQALRAPTDSAALLRALVDVERSILEIERAGWATLRSPRPMPPGTDAAPYLLEAGANLAASCPVGGVLVTGTEVEAAAVWSVMFGSRDRMDLVLLLATPYRADSGYRTAMAEALGVSPALPVAAALGEAARRRPVCLSPGVRPEAVPEGPLVAMRLVRVAGARAPLDSAGLSVVELLRTELARPTPLQAEVLGIYRAAAGFNPVLCTTLLLPFAVHHRAACRN